MGKAGRVACIFTPGLLTIASLICIIMVGLGCTKASSGTLNNLYFARFDLQNLSSSGSKTSTEIENILEENGITSVNASEVSDIIQQLQDDSTLADFYQFGLWSYCDGNISNSKFSVEECSKPKSEFYFDPLSVWGLEDSAVKDELPDDYNKLMKVYKAVSKWMFIAYLIAFIVTIVQILVGFFAICSRWGSCVTTIFAAVAFLFTTAASVTSTVLFVVMKGTIKATLEAYGITLSMGKNIFVATWLAVAFSLAGLIFWFFSICCCSGRSPYGHRNGHNNPRALTAEKAPYTYEPLGAGQHTSYPPRPPPLTADNTP
ncbi:hypothetical protein N7462_010159 [Penicillium macrosclerotiorum]|uniref:uncharacterized protein n=1 Tax=Penicillium macrosclerotiorum TaxID=303699 RepID=UPI00254669EC|nr:uncharacterized protein N7462_010159 [Penicillium macrosclerotiorum]KAJ5669089.1 hypothetical protein N7462_010159 [Penicillium macrosclerotiorum]